MSRDRAGSGAAPDQQQAAADDDREPAALRQVAPLVGSSPRTAKRFVNVYRTCKARALIDPDLRGEDLAGLRLAVEAAPDSPEARRVSGFLSVGAALLDLPMTQPASWLPVVRRFARPASGRG